MRYTQEGIRCWNCKPWFVIGFLILVGMGCDTQNLQEDFIRDADRTPSGFTNTDAGGQIISTDDDDWRTAPVYLGTVRVDPPFPNPTGADFVSLPITISQFNQLRGGMVLRARDRQGRFIILDEILEARDPGAYVFNFTPIELNEGLQRLFIFDSVGELVSYGDLMVQ